MKVWLANFMIFFSFMVLTPLLPLYLSDTFGVGKHTIGLILSGYTLTALLVRGFSGWLVDSYPRRLVLLTSYFFFFLFFGGYFFAGWGLALFAVLRTLHGAPFGTVTVANSTVAIDVLHSSRRAEGIGYYGLSNNLATAISPSIGLYIYGQTGSYDLIFLTALLTSGVGLAINASLQLSTRPTVPNKQHLSLDRFFLLKGWSESVAMVTYSFSYGVLVTFIAIYSRDELGITEGSGLFFTVLCCGLIFSRLVGSWTLRQGKILQNATLGVTVSVFGYLLFAAVKSEIGYYGAALIIGLGNGHMFPAFQNMFINLAPNSQRGTANSTLLTSWDVGMGLGIVLGGAVAEIAGYSAAFWMAWLVNLSGVLFFYLWVRRNYQKNKLR